MWVRLHSGVLGRRLVRSCVWRIPRVVRVRGPLACYSLRESGDYITLHYITVFYSVRSLARRAAFGLAPPPLEAPPSAPRRMALCSRLRAVPSRLAEALTR